jgi:hypothetical protein
MEDQAQRIGRLFFDRLEKLLSDPENELKAADYEMVRKVLSDNSITISQVRRGDFGKVVQTAAEEFPFPGDDDAAEEYATPIQ